MWSKNKYDWIFRQSFSCVSLPFLSSHQEAFSKAAEEAKTLPNKPNDEELSALYGLYKQAQFGDVNTGKSVQ